MPTLPTARRLLVPLVLAAAMTGCAKEKITPVAPFDADPQRAMNGVSVVDFGTSFAIEDVAGTQPMFDGRTGEPMTAAMLHQLLAEADVIILGENHADAVGHQLQARFVAAALPGATGGEDGGGSGGGDGGGGALTLEMLTRADAQSGRRLDVESSLVGSGLESWTNWREFYLPSIEAARRAGRPVVAANAPREYVVTARVSGYDVLRNLDQQSQTLFDLPPEDMDIDLELGHYRENFAHAMAMSHGEDVEPQQPGPTTIPATLPATRPAEVVMQRPMLDAHFDAQLVWDATMAQSIYRARSRYGAPIVHLVGAFHSDFDGGTTTLLKRRGLDVMTVSFVPATSGRLRPDDVGRADVVVYTGELPAVIVEEETTEDQPIGRMPAVIGEGPITPATLPATLPATRGNGSETGN